MSEDKVSRYKISELDEKMRGRYLYVSTSIEELMSEVICAHFYPKPDFEEGELLFGLILHDPGLLFKRKYLIMKHLLELKYSELLVQYRKQIEAIEKVGDMRNHLAHVSPYETDETRNYTDRILLVYFKNGKEVKEHLTMKDFERRLNNAYDAVIGSYRDT